jgi:hypothetical protein
MAVSRQKLAGPSRGATAGSAGRLPAAAKRCNSGKPVMNHLSLGYQVTRLVFDAGQPYEKFSSRYEAAVPSADLQPGDCAGRHVRWQDVTADANGSGPHGFVLYWRADMTPTLTGSGELRPCTGYLMGHHAIPEKAYLHDPAVMLHVPLRTSSTSTPPTGPGSPSISRAPCTLALLIQSPPSSGAISTVSSPSCSTRSASRQARGCLRLARFQCGADPAAGCGRENLIQRRRTDLAFAKRLEGACGRMGGEAALFPASRLRTSAIRAAWAVWCRAWRSSRPGAQQEQREHAVGFGQIERAFQGPSSISSADLGSSTWAMVISAHVSASEKRRSGARISVSSPASRSQYSPSRRSCRAAKTNRSSAGARITSSSSCRRAGSVTTSACSSTPLTSAPVRGYRQSAMSWMTQSA